MAMSRSLGGTSFTRRSPMKISPAVASSSPAMRRSAVVFPQPDGPTRTVNCLSGISRVSSFTAVTAPNFLVTPASCTLATRSPPVTTRGSWGKIPVPFGLSSIPYPLLPRLSPGQPLLEFVNHRNRRGIHFAQHGQVPADEIADQYRRQQPGQLPCPGRMHLIEPARPRQCQIPGDRCPQRQPRRLDRVPENDHVQQAAQRVIQAPAYRLIVVQLRQGVPDRERL